MTRARKVLFATVTLLILLLVVEGLARLLWWRLEERSLRKTMKGGEQLLQNDAINFMKEPDSVLGYVLKPGFDGGRGQLVGQQGFAQQELVPRERVPGNLRVAAMGESTTQGHDIYTANYPRYLKRLLEWHAPRPGGIEMINAGVSGWYSDQVALWAERKVAAFQPDVVVLYVGWNDFQVYDPFVLPFPRSAFYDSYGGTAYLIESSPFKLVWIASALAERVRSRRLEAKKAVEAYEIPGGPKRQYAASPEETYQYFVQSMDRLVGAFRQGNPEVKIAVCTLVARWPAGTLADYASRQGATYWMKMHALSPQDAAASHKRFNEVIREYARQRHLALVDAEVAFSKLDRATLQWDFAHFTAEGYELLAEVIYESLRTHSIVAGGPSPRMRQLIEKYRAQ
jgi:lysophospholipase L1-like esterase